MKSGIRSKGKGDNMLKRYTKVLRFILLTAILLGLFAPASGPIHVEAARMNPGLMYMAQEAPDRLLKVIVQKSDNTNEAEELVERLGGVITKDLHMINAFAAELLASEVLDLSKSASVQWVSLDAPMVSSGKPTTEPEEPLPQTYFLDTLNVRAAWDLGYQGEGITVAVIDSGINTDRDFTVIPGRPHTRILAQVSLASGSTSDEYGHGTHVAGIVGGHGGASEGLYSGIAPKVNLINLRVSDDFGMAYESDTVEAMQWAFDNKELFNIRVVNLSINSTAEMSYHESPLNAAAEILWFNGIVVVASSGNKGPAGGYNTANAAPANDPFILTVGASDEHDTFDRSDDTVAPYTAHGTTMEGHVKPDIIAPGQDIISVLAYSSDWYNDYPERAVLGQEYFRISGTSMAAPMVTGAVALLLQAEPNLTPDQVKYRLMNTGTELEGYAYLDVNDALSTTTYEAANEGEIPHMLLAKMALIAYWSSEECGEDCDWDNVDWDSVNWDSVNWDSVNWNSIDWASVNWNSVNWNSVNWNSVNWNSVNWNSVNWNSVNWNSVNWNSVNWNSVQWNGVLRDKVK
jgi:serine protease AprX